MELPSLPQLTQQVEGFLTRGDSSRAIAMSDQLFSALPEDPPVRLIRRTALHRAGAVDHPWGELPTADAAAETKLSTAWATLALAQFSLHRFQDADSSLRRALSADPSNPFALATMAVVLHERRQNEKAVALTRLLEDVPGAGELIDEIRQEARQRNLARELVERNAYLEPQRTPGFSIWLWLAVLAVLASVAMLALQPESLLGYGLCVAVPLGFVLVLRKLFS